MTYKCVLVVEDNKDISFLIKHALEKNGYIVFVAENGREALHKLDILADEHRPCLILCDLQMPVMDGWQFIEALGKINKLATIPLVIHSSDGVTPDGYQSLNKPVSIDALMKVVEQHCGKITTEPCAVVV